GILLERVQVPEDEDGPLVVLRLEHEAERLERVLAVTLGLAAEAHALGDRPRIDLGPVPLLLLARVEDALDALLDPPLLAGEDVDERVSRPHQVLDVLVDAPELRRPGDLLGDLLRL